MERFDADLPGAETWGIVGGPDAVAYTRVEDGRFVHRIRSLAGPASEPSRVLAAVDQLSSVAGCSPDGSVIAFRHFRDDFRQETVLRDAASGDVIAEVSSPHGSVVAVRPSQLPGDGRYLGDMDVDGRRRPIAWDPASGTIERLPSGDMPGDLRVVAVSPSGRWVALLQEHAATTALHGLELASGRVRRLGAPRARSGRSFRPRPGSWPRTNC